MPVFWPRTIPFVPRKKVGTTGFSLKAEEMYTVIEKALAFGYEVAGDELKNGFRTIMDTELVRELFCICVCIMRVIVLLC